MSGFACGRFLRHRCAWRCKEQWRRCQRACARCENARTLKRLIEAITLEHPKSHWIERLSKKLAEQEPPGD